MLISQVHIWILYRCILFISDKKHGYHFFKKKESKKYLIYSLFKINSCDLDLKERFDFYFRSYHILTLTTIWHLNTLYEIVPFLLVPFLLRTLWMSCLKVGCYLNNSKQYESGRWQNGLHFFENQIKSIWTLRIRSLVYWSQRVCIAATHPRPLNLMSHHFDL